MNPLADGNPRIVLAQPLVMKADVNRELADFAGRILEITAEMLRRERILVDMSEECNLMHELQVHGMLVEERREELATQWEAETICEASLEISELVAVLSRICQRGRCAR